MARKDKLAEVFSAELSGDDASRLPAGNPAPSRSKPAPFGLNRYAADHLQTPNARYVQEIDPEVIHEAGPADRMDTSDAEADAALRASIQQTGQTTPVLLRPDPDQAGRFRIIYGRRRVRALKALGQKVKAIIRDDISETDAVIIQGQENSVRKDLSFLERARFLVAIEAEGFARAVAIDALSIDKARASNYAKLGNVLPDDVARRIGPAPGIGRDRWLAFVAAWESTAKADELVARALDGLDPTQMDSDARFAVALGALRDRPQRAPEKPATAKRSIGQGSGKDRVVFATIRDGAAGLSVNVPAKSAEQKDFAEHLKARIDAMLREELETWQRTRGSGN